MKKTLAILAILITVSACNKKNIPDETLIVQGDELYLPPEFVLYAPENIKQTVNKQSKATSKDIIMGSSSFDNSEIGQKVNTWLLDNAGGQARVKNIKKIIKNDNLANSKEI